MTEANGHHAIPAWFVTPGDNDILAWVALATMAVAGYGLVLLYSWFDKWAEHQSHGTPLAKTIPTMLTMALLYEIFPLNHFHILLPISALLIALMADWSRFHLNFLSEKPEPSSASHNPAPPRTDQPITDQGAGHQND